MSVTPPMQPTDWENLKQVFIQAFRSNPRNFGNWQANTVGGGYEPSPVEDMLGSSPLLDYIRQGLPRDVQSSPLAQVLPDDAPDWLRQIPLGGYSPERAAQLQEARSADPAVRARTLQRGMVPSAADPTTFVPVGDGFRPNAAQAAGAAVADVAGVQGLQNIWWFLNAPQALTTLATLQATHGAGKDSRGVSVAPLLKSRNMRMAATAPAWIGMSFGVGSFGRQPGFEAAVPSEMDPTVTADPLAEIGSRFFLGRSGKMMPYDEFAQERPDVSRGEYEAYKAYLHGNNMPIKATLEGINGPEVTFLGKSMPVLTAIAPAVAAAVGARMGANKAARRLAASPEGNLIEMRDAALNNYQRAQGGDAIQEVRSGDARKPTRHAGAKRQATQEEIQDYYNEYARINNLVEDETLKQTLLYGGGSMTAAALIGSTMETARRALKGKAPDDEETTIVIEPSATLSAPRANQRTPMP